jgi:RimJ/RimL family protein N-acetyltransferase
MSIIETERFIMRPFKESDAEDVYEYLKEPAVNCFAEMKLHSLDEAKAEVKNRIGETEYYFAITLKDTGKVIGEIDAYTEDYNISSQHLCEKLGMRKEGLFKEFISFVNNPDGTPRYENTMQYAILSKEWSG